MKHSTRDNLIYLSVAFIVATLVIADFFYSDSRGRQMWLPANFAYRLVAYIGVLGYLVGRETRKVGANTLQVILCVIAAAVMQAGVAFCFHQTFSGRYSLILWTLWVGGGFAIIKLLVWAVELLNQHNTDGSA
jgi:hypothetical protein